MKKKHLPVFALPAVGLAACLTLWTLGCAHDHDHPEEAEEESWAVTAWGEEFEIFAELQTAVSVGQCQRAFDVVGNGFAGGVRQIIERQNNDVVAHTNPAIFAAVSEEGWYRRF